MDLTYLAKAKLTTDIPACPYASTDIHPCPYTATNRDYVNVGLKEYVKTGLKVAIATPEVINYITDIVQNHKSGCTSEAAIIYIKGWLLRMNKTFSDIKDDPEARQVFLTEVPSLNSIAQAIPLSLVLNTIAHRVHTLFTIGDAPTQTIPILQEPDYFDIDRDDHPKLKPENRIYVDQACAIPLEKILTSEKQILTPEDIQGTVVFMVNNLFSKLTESGIQKAKDNIDNLAQQIRAIDAVQQVVIVHMGNWSEFYPEKPEITLPFDHSNNTPQKTLVDPTFIEVGLNFSDMKTAAILDGATGNPFLCERKGVLVFHQFNGTQTLPSRKLYDGYIEPEGIINEK